MRAFRIPFLMEQGARLALLEVLVHADLGRVPKTHVVIEINIPDTLPTEVLASDDLPGWNDEDQMASRAFGDKWLSEQRSAVLLVPSVVTHGVEHNVLINPEHSDFPGIIASKPQSVQCHKRLFRHR
jgi:RES domain-containing protein